MPKSNTDFWVAKITRNRERDGETRRRLEEAGVRQLVIWECTVRAMRKDEEKCDEVLAAILNFLHSNQQYLEL